MNKMFILPTSLILYFIFIASTDASIKNDLFNCAKIKSSSERLDCYDTLTKYYKYHTSNIEIKPMGEATAIPSPATPGSRPISIKVNGNQTLANEDKRGLNPSEIPVAQKQSVEQDFGRVDKENSLESIQSKLIGSFTSWKKGMLLKLENGQTWKVTSNSSGYKKMNSPLIVITTGIFGSFNAKVEGLNAKAKVKRIK